MIIDKIKGYEPTYTAISPIQQGFSMPNERFELRFDTVSVNPFWCACHIDYDGVTSSQKGIHNLVCVDKNNPGDFNMTFPPHPDGLNYVVMLTSTEYHVFYRSITDSSFILSLRIHNNSASFSHDGFINCIILK